jgi:hypothetical protein
MSRMPRRLRSTYPRRRSALAVRLVVLCGLFLVALLSAADRVAPLAHAEGAATPTTTASDQDTTVLVEESELCRVRTTRPARPLPRTNAAVAALAPAALGSAVASRPSLTVAPGHRLNSKTPKVRTHAELMVFLI